MGEAVDVEVEYCGTCGYGDKFEEMKNILLNKQPGTQVIGTIGRTGTFEVKINNTLIHSKLSTLAFPDFDDVSNIVAEVKAGNEVRKTCKQQPITSCCLM